MWTGDKDSAGEGRGWVEKGEMGERWKEEKRNRGGERAKGGGRREGKGRERGALCSRIDLLWIRASGCCEHGRQGDTN